MWLLLTTLTSTAFGACDPDDPLLGTNDCDEDGSTVEDGDCDDDEPTVHPGAVERCEDELDNDCDGWINLGCDDAPQRGSLAGGGCGTSSSTPAGSMSGQDTGLALLFFLFMGRRRR